MTRGDDDGGPLTGHNVGPLAEGTTRIRVTYRDTDQMGMVYYANYLVYFETGRTELLRELGRTYRDLESDGVFLPVRDARCRYHAPARYDDVLVVTTRVERWTRAAMDFRYEVRREGEEELLAEGTTRHAFMSRDGRILRVGGDVLAGEKDGG